MEKFTSVIIAAMFAVPAMAQRTVDGTDLPTNIIKDQPEGTLEKNLTPMHMILTMYTTASCISAMLMQQELTPCLEIMARYTSKALWRHSVWTHG